MAATKKSGSRALKRAFVVALNVRAKARTYLRSNRNGNDRNNRNDRLRTGSFERLRAA